MCGGGRGGGGGAVGWGPGCKYQVFWPTIRPFLANKGYIGDDKITIIENDQVITDTLEICSKFNNIL